LGADGVVLGTRLWASVESMGPASFKKALVNAKSADDVVRTRAFDVISNSFRPVKWPAPYDTSSALRNKITDKWDTKISELEAELNKNPDSSIVTDFKRANAENDVYGAPVYAGKGVGKVKSIDAAFDIVTRTAEEALIVLRGLRNTYVEAKK
jgi:nitronate monooxygenase